MYNKKVLSTAKKELNKAKAPKKPKDIITDPMGQWKYPGLPTRIPGNDITMKGVDYPVLGISNNGQKQMMQPGKEYTFPGAEYVDEYPQMKRGGTRKRRKTKSLSGTNELMLQHPLLRNYKNRVYDPNVDYFQDGGRKTTKSKDGTITNVIQNPDGTKTVQVKTKDGKYYEKVVAAPVTSINPLTGKPLVVMPKNATISNDYFNYKEEDGLSEDLGELIDPTGITSWDDVRRAYDENGLFDPKTGLEILGALPLVGKIGKSGKILAGGEKLFLDAVKYFGYNDKIANAYKAYRKFGGKNLDDVLGLTTKGLTKLSPKLNPEKWESSMKLINGLNKFTEGAKATKLLPYTPSGDTQTKNDEEYIEADLTEDEIEEYRRGGYIVEDISVPELNQAQEGIIQISDPKEFAYREKKYNDSLNAYNYGQKKLEKRNEINKKYNIKENPANKWPASDKNSLVQKMVQKRTIYDVAPTDVLFTDGFHSYYGDVNGKKNKDPNLLISMTNKESGIPIHADSQDYKDLTFTVPFYKKPTQKPVLKSKKNEYPVGYQPYSLYGKVLDPETYGYGESNEGKPVQLGQYADALGRELQMKKYKKANKYPWVKQEGGLIEAQKGGIKTHKSEDGTITNTITKPNGDVVIQVKTKDGKYYEKVKHGLPQFVKDEFKKRADWENRSSGMAQPVDDFWTLPMGMSSAGVKGAGALAKGAGTLLKNAGKSNLVQLSKAGAKTFWNKAPKWAPGMNLGNALTSLGIVEGATNYFDADSDVRKANKKAYKNPNFNTITEALGENIINSLDFSGLAAGNKIGKLTNYITKETPLKNIPNLFKKDIKYVNLQDQIDDIVKNSSFKTEGEAFDYLIDHAKKNNKSVDDLLNIYSRRGFGFSHSNPIAAAEMIKNDLHPYVSPYLYHGTSDARLKSILESGLDNSKGKAVNTGGMMADVLGGGKTTAAGDMRYAKSFSEITANATEGKPVILRFKNKNKENLGFVGMQPSVKGKDIEYSFDGGKTWSNKPNFNADDKQLSGSSNVAPIVNTTPTFWTMQEMPGLHLKSTMSDGAVSKIVEPKTGLVNIEQALGIIGKESGGVDKVALIKQGLGKTLPKKMDYNEFRKVVQDQLIPLERQFVDHASDYGINRLGYKEPEFITRNVNGKIVNELTSDVIENQTLILSNKNKFGRGSSAHNNPDETLGHIHFLRDVESPDVLTVTQIQSDAFQSTHGVMPDKSDLNSKIKKLEWYLSPEGKEFIIKNNSKEAAELNIKAATEQIEKFKKELTEGLGSNPIQKQLLNKNHQERYLQELVNYAGERDDISKLRLPTSETAAKIQNYKKSIPTHLDDNLQPVGGGEYSSKHQTILKKYAEQPKLIKKLFGAEPKIVTDSKGNTWYEFDIPERFKGTKGEIKAFSMGGMITNPASITGKEIIQEKQNGGYIETELTNDEIQDYIKQGYIVEDVD